MFNKIHDECHCVCCHWTCWSQKSEIQMKLLSIYTPLIVKISCFLIFCITPAIIYSLMLVTAAEISLYLDCMWIVSLSLRSRSMRNHMDWSGEYSGWSGPASHVWNMPEVWAHSAHWECPAFNFLYAVKPYPVKGIVLQIDIYLGGMGEIVLWGNGDRSQHSQHLQENCCPTIEQAGMIDHTMQFWMYTSIISCVFCGPYIHVMLVNTVIPLKVSLIHKLQDSPLKAIEINCNNQPPHFHHPH